MPFSAQNITKTFSVKIQCFMETVVWALFKLSFEHFFVESALFDILSNPDVMLCSCPPETTCQSCCGISAGVFCTCYSLRFHAISKMDSDYQWVTKRFVAASRQRSHWFCKRNSSAALSEFNCDCRLRIDPSAADAEWPRAGLVWHRGACQC